MKCPNCGTELISEAKFCTKCGIPIHKQLSLNSKDLENEFDDIGVDGTQVNNKNFVWKEKYTYLFLAVAVVCAVILGIIIKTIKSGDKGLNSNPVIEVLEDTVYGKDEELEDFEDDDEKDKNELENDEKIFSGEDDAQESDDSIEEPVDENVKEPIVKKATKPIKMNKIISVTASSELSEYNTTHSADRVVDNDLEKAWVEDADGQGIGESLYFTFDKKYKIKGIKINAGYQKSRDLYFKNSRPKNLSLYFSNGACQTIKLEDVYRRQTIKLPKSVVSDSVEIVIDSVYAGNKYDDTVISEIAFY